MPIKFKKNKSGITLVETMVAVSIMILINGILSVFIIKTFDINRYTIEQGLNTAVIQNTLHSITKYLREARQSDAGSYLIESAGEFDLVFFSDIDDDSPIERVHIYLENSQIKMGISEASGFPPQYSGADEEIRILASGVANENSEPIFTYYNSDYPSDLTNNPLAVPVSPEDISLIRVFVYANIDPDHIPNRTQIETFVRPRNID